MVSTRNNREFEPDRITLSLIIGKNGDKKSTAKTVVHKQAIVSYLTENIDASCADIAEFLGLQQSRTREILEIMINEEIVVATGENKNRTYKLKA